MINEVPSQDSIAGRCTSRCPEACKDYCSSASFHVFKKTTTLSDEESEDWCVGEKSRVSSCCTRTGWECFAPCGGPCLCPHMCSCKVVPTKCCYKDHLDNIEYVEHAE